MSDTATAAPHRVVVVGAGMVGTRFVDELVRADVSHRFAVLLVGAEAYEPYNRVLLSQVLAGEVDIASLTLPASEDERVRVLRGAPVRAIDRSRRQVATDEGSHPYDTLVLATGASAQVIDVDGLPAVRDGVHVLRTLDDCRDLLAAALNARRAVVVGGGLLGVEIACGLRARGVQVDLVHRGPHLLDRHLGPSAGRVVAASAAGLGIAVHLGRTPRQFVTARGRVTGVRLDDGATLGGDLVVLATGTRPQVQLAAAAGLPTDHGILVGDDLRCPGDPRVAAIGDCAQPPRGCTGLVDQGWQQARRLALHLTGSPPAPSSGTGTGQVVRLKAHGLDVLTLGAVEPATPGARSLTLDDPDGRRYVQVVVQEGRLVAATCVGARERSADLTVLYDRGTPVPVDPALLLVGGAHDAPAEASSPTRMPATATVCRCNAVTKQEVVRAWESGAASVAEVAARTRAGTGCGGCRGLVQGLLDWLADAEPDRGERTGRSPRPHTDTGEHVSGRFRAGNNRGAEAKPSASTVRS